MKTKLRASLAALVVSLAVVSSCAKVPPTLTPVGVKAFQATQAVHVLDLVRDTAIAAEAAQPQLLSTETTRKVVQWHRVAVALAGQTPAGWEATVLSGLTEVERALKPGEREVLAPYLALAKTILMGVS